MSVFVTKKKLFVALKLCIVCVCVCVREREGGGGERDVFYLKNALV
jgi:hypothetical protein